MLKIQLSPTVHHILFALGYAVAGIVFGAITFMILTLDATPDLHVWHQAHLENEYSYRRNASFIRLDQYRELENRLFHELDEEVYKKIPAESRVRINRFNKGASVDPTSFAHNWNRTVELSHKNPRAGFLLLHGLSDSPYSLRKMAQTLHARQSWVVALRLPGHGTAPSGLVRVSWKDFTSAVRLAARHLRDQIGPDVPLYIVGYSNGAALALEYTLAGLEGEALPKPSGLVLISPAVGVSRLAALAPWRRRISYLPGLHKLAWISIQPEFDPYKYNSFALNASEQIHYLTSDIAERINRLDQGSGVRNFPPTLAFTSIVDATVSVDALVNTLLVRLAPNQHRLVVYDMNREANTASILSVDPEKIAESLFARKLPFDLVFLTNKNDESTFMVQKIKRENADAIETIPTRLQWPDTVYSLSHVALPFAPDDPIYGSGKAVKGMHVSLGNIEPRGERGVLQVPISQFMRLRYNPFYSFQEQQILNRYFK